MFGLSAPALDGLAVGLAVIAFALTACNGAASAPTPSLATLFSSPPTASPPTVRATAPATALAITTTQIVTLTVWAPEEFTPGASRAGQVLQKQVDDFVRAHENIAVTFNLKNRYGKGGLLDFMRQVQTLVPSRLPDLVVIDSREVDVVANARLLQPLERELPAGAFADLLPPAQTLAQSNGQWLLAPLTLEFQHLAYNSQVVRAPPATWDQVLTGTAPIAFAAEGDDAFVFQYLDNGGGLAPPQSAAPLDLATTTTVLSFFQRARAANLVPDSVFGLKTPREVWQIFATRQVSMALVEASDFWSGAERLANVAYAPLPTRAGRATTLVSAWGYAVVTSDPRRHAAAVEFLKWMNQPARHAEWAAAAHLIPARRSAFALALAPRAYADFLLRLLDNAIVAPTFAERAPYQQAWRAALISVLRGQATASEAAVRAAQASLP